LIEYILVYKFDFDSGYLLKRHSIDNLYYIHWANNRTVNTLSADFTWVDMKKRLL